MLETLVKIWFWLMSIGTFGLTFFFIARSLFGSSYVAPELLKEKGTREEEIAFAQKLGMILFLTTWLPFLALAYAFESTQ